MLLLNVNLLCLRGLTYYALSMFDGIESDNVRLPIDTLLTSERLLFPGLYNRQTGEVVERSQRASENGLTFTLIPPGIADSWRCKLQGSMHRYFNHGVHNADGFTAANLLQVIDLWVSRYGIEPALTPITNLEFGLNLALPFPVSRVLDNLISYKDGKPFTLKHNKVGDRYTYYHCVNQQYEFKLYDKGLQFERVVEGLPANLLRVEINVTRMRYFEEKKISIRTLADLLDPANYAALGELLVKAFTNILFDEPSLSQETLTPEKRELYLNGINPRYWIRQRAELQQVSQQYGPRSKEYGAARQRAYQHRQRFKQLLQQSRQAEDWPAWTAALLAQRWVQVSTVSRELATAMATRRANWLAVGANNLTVSTGYFVRPKRVKPNILTGSTDPKPNNLTGFDSPNPNNLTDLAGDSPNILTDLQATDPTSLTGSELPPETGQTSHSNHLDIGLECYTGPSSVNPEEEVLNSSSSTVPVEGEDLGFAGSDQPAPAVDSLGGGSVPVEPSIKPKSVSIVSPKPVVPRYRPGQSDPFVESTRPVKPPAQPKAKPTAETIDTFTPVPPMFPHPSTLGQYAEYDEQGRKRRWCPLSGIETTAQRPDSVIVDRLRMANVDWSKPSNAVWLDTLLHQYLTPYQWKHSDGNMRFFDLLDRMRIRWARLHGRKP